MRCVLLHPTTYTYHIMIIHLLLLSICTICCVRSIRNTVFINDLHNTSICACAYVRTCVSSCLRVCMCVCLRVGVAMYVFVISYDYEITGQAN